LARLCIGTLGLSPKYCPFEMVRVLERAVDWLVACGFLAGMRIEGKRLTRESKVIFTKATKKTLQRRPQTTVLPDIATQTIPVNHRAWLIRFSETELHQSESLALEARFGSELEQKIILEERALGKAIKDSGPIRTEYVRKFVESNLLTKDFADGEVS
jgi:predicted phage-related endonuclease